MMRRRRGRLATVLLALATSPLGAQRVPPIAPVDILEAQARADSLDPVRHYQLAIGYLSRERWNDADAALRRAIALDDRHAPSHLAYAVAQDQNNDYWRRLERARGRAAVAQERQRRAAAARRAYMLDPFVNPQILAYSRSLPRELRRIIADGDYGFLFQEIERLRIRVLLRMETPSEDSLPPGLLYLHATWAAQIERYPDAIRSLSALIRVTLPTGPSDSLVVPMAHTELAYVLAAMYERNEQPDEALELYAVVVSNDLGAYMAHVRRAALYEQKRDWRQAIGARLAAVRANPEDPTLTRDLARTLLRAGQPGDADSILGELRETNPADIQVLYLQGVARQALGRAADARTAYTAFLARAPTSLASAIADARRRLAALDSAAR